MKISDLAHLSKYLMITIFLLGCDNKEHKISDDILSAHLLLEEQINDFLLKNESISSFGGEVYCRHKLIGGSDNEFYIVFHCQEYYQIIADSIFEGTSIRSLAVVKWENSEIRQILKSRDGGAFRKDIENMFPRKIALQILDNRSNLYIDIMDEMKALRRNQHERREKNMLLFDSILAGEKKADFYAAGGEPFWTMYVLKNEMLLMNSNILSRHNILDEFQEESTTQVVRYISHIGDTNSVEITRENQFEELSSRTYPYGVHVDINENFTLRGVGSTNSLE